MLDGSSNPYFVKEELFTQHLGVAVKDWRYNARICNIDLSDVQAAAARSHGIRLVINTDAHSITGLADMRYGVLQARRAGLTRDDVANTRSWKQLKKLIGK